jgi:hypothetical protein
MKIVIGQRGWVWIGEYAEEGDRVVLTNARCIRRWGTTKGLGEIAEGGPTEKTVLDPAGTVRIHVLAVVATLDANEEAWAGK